MSEPVQAPRFVDTALRCALGVAIAVGATVVAMKRAPSSSAVTPLPPSSSASAEPAQKKATDDVDVVSLRLTEAFGQATVEMPTAERALQAMSAHWRRLQMPWLQTPPSDRTRARLIELVTLRTSAHETPHTIVTSSGVKATFDVRMWNMAEGSFAEREAIVAPTPSTIRFHLRVPVGAAFEVAPAVLAVGDSGDGGGAGTVDFKVRALVAGEPPIDLQTKAIGASDRNQWRPLRIDLAALGGKEIDLELTTSASPREGYAPSQAQPIAAIALWGTPQIVQRTESKLPYDVLWIVVDSLRPDVLASFHDEAFDAERRAAKIPPGYALLPKLEGVTPNIDALAKRGAVFRRANSAAPWTRPGTIAMLSGVHSQELGVSTLPWSLPEPMLDAYYASKPPLFALAFRRAGAATRAFVNNNFMLGYAQVGVDLGFEEVEDFRYRTMDTAEITKAALASMRAHAGERSLLFVNYNSPHDPYDPTPECLARVPGWDNDKKREDQPKDAIRDPAVRGYIAEACKDDAAIGELLAELDREGKRDRTLIVVTADHGETLAERHEMIALGLDEVKTRFHHAFGHWEETTRIPILLSLPGVVPEGSKVDARVSNLDLAPTLLRLEGLEVDPRQRGVDLIALAKGAPAPVRPMISIGRASQAIVWDHFRYVHRDEAAQRVLLGGGDEAKTLTIRWELFDLHDDPGEQHNLGGDPAYTATIDDLKARMTAALAGVPAADAPASAGPIPKLHLRFAGGGGAHRVQVTLKAKDARSIVATPIFMDAAAISQKGDTVDVAATTAIDALVGCDFVIDPPTTAITWTISIDDHVLGDDAVFGGLLGVAFPGLAKGISSSEMRASIASPLLPFVDPAIDIGVFVTTDPSNGQTGPIERASAGAAAAEVQSALRSWGYAK